MYKGSRFDGYRQKGVECMWEMLKFQFNNGDDRILKLKKYTLKKTL